MFEFGDSLKTPLPVVSLEDAFNLAPDYVRIFNLGMPRKIHENMAECHRGCVDLYCKLVSTYNSQLGVLLENTYCSKENPKKTATNFI